MLAALPLSLGWSETSCVTSSHHCVLGFKENELDVAKSCSPRIWDSQASLEYTVSSKPEKKEGRRKNINPVPTKIP